MSDKKQKKILFWIAGSAAALAGLWFLFTYLLHWLLPFLIGFALAWMLEPIVRLMVERLHFPRGVSSAICTLALVGLLVLIVCMLGNRVFFELSALIRELPARTQSVSMFFEKLRAYIDQWILSAPIEIRPSIESIVDQIYESGAAIITSLSSKAADLLSKFVAKLPSSFLFLFTTLLSIFFASSEYPAVKDFIARQIPEKWRDKIQLGKHRLKETLGQWLRAQLKLMCLTYIELAIGFFIIGIDYALLLAGVTALIDALPVFGTGTVLIPWAVVTILQGDVKCGASLILLYGVVALVRNIMEPKLIGKQMGVSPLVTLMAMYIGFCVANVWGMILAPIAFVLIKQLHDWGYIHIWK